MAAVLEREDALRVECARPVDELRVALGAGPDGHFTPELAELRADGDCRVGLFVRVDTDYDHLVPFRYLRMEGGPPADRPHWGLLAKLLLGHAGVPRTAAGDRTR